MFYSSKSCIHNPLLTQASQNTMKRAVLAFYVLLKLKLEAFCLMEARCRPEERSDEGRRAPTHRKLEVRQTYLGSPMLHLSYPSIHNKLPAQASIMEMNPDVP